jgi:AmiR/NasT family two-component response regulator
MIHLPTGLPLRDLATVSGESVKQTRILIANMPGILQEMIAAIVSSESRLRIVGKLAKESDLVAAIRRTRADVVIIRETHEEDDVDDEALLICRRSAKMLAITKSGREAALYQLRLQRTPLGEISADGLISAIDKAVNS